MNKPFESISVPRKTACIVFALCLLNIAPALTLSHAADAGVTSATAAKPEAAGGIKLAFPDEKIDAWHSFKKRHNFVVDGCQAWVVEPNQALPGNPWSWCMEFPDVFTENCGATDLLKAGYFHAHIKVGNTFGSPEAIRHFNAFYKILTGAGLARKATLIGMSRGGLYAYRWASENPDKVAVIYGDNPVCDFKSWPGGKGKGKGSKGDWQQLLRCYGFKDEAEALAYPGNPIDILPALAKAGIALIHVVGDADDVVPVAENTAIVEERYKKLGGIIEVIHKPGAGHHPHGLGDKERKPVVDFILKHGGALPGGPQGASPTTAPLNHPVAPASVAPTSVAPASSVTSSSMKAAPAVPKKGVAETKPTLENVAYGDHPKQVLSFWKAESVKPAPLVFYIHGGGWAAGANGPPYGLPWFLNAKISVVSIQYRFTWEAEKQGIKPPVKGPMDDVARALQFVRSKASEWNIDKNRIGAHGISAGACSSLWLAFHDDMAKPDSPDPIARESTRPTCVAVMNAQTTLDPVQMREWTPNSNYGGHAFGFHEDRIKKISEFQQFLNGRETVLPWIKEYSPYELVKKDAPPVFLWYNSQPNVGKDAKDPVHSSNFGVKLKERMDAAGGQCELFYTGATGAKHNSCETYLIEYLKK